MAILGMKCDRNVRKKTFVEIIQESGRRWGRNSFGTNETEQQYVQVRVNQTMRNMQMEMGERE